MKPCRFCGEQISDAAKKCFHCQSFQDPNDAPKPGFDVAQLVISFIGMIALVGTVLAGLFAFFGYSTLNRVVTETSGLQQSTLEILNEARTRISAFSEEIAEAQKRTRKLEIELYAMLGRQKYSHLQTLMESLILDRLWHTTDYLDELRDLSRSVHGSGLISNNDISQNIIDKRTEIKATVEAIENYRIEDYQRTIDVLQSVSNSSLNKHRLLGAAYNKLYSKAQREHSPAKLAQYQSLIVHHTEQYATLASRANKTTVIAKNNQAIALMKRNNAGDLETAYKLLNDARRDAPNSIPIAYNLAVYHIKTKDFHKALDELGNFKRFGGLISVQDKDKFKNDQDMLPLFENNDDQIKAAVRDFLN